MSSTQDGSPAAAETPHTSPLAGRVINAIIFPTLLIVVAWGAIITIMVHADRLTLSHETLEDLALGLLSEALVLAIIFIAIRRTAFAVWLALIVLVFLCREIHFAYTSTGVYIGIATLGVVALAKPQWVEGWLTRPLIATLFACAFASYVFAVSLDGHWWFDWDDSWIEAGTTSEELLELTGHVLITWIVLFTGFRSV